MTDQALLAPKTKPKGVGAPAPQTPWQNRIVGYGDAPIGSLVPHPANWRLHPPAQRAALSGLVGDIGLVATAIVSQRTSHILDGHLRVELAQQRGEATLPVTYVDVSDDEERLILAAFDPVGALASADRQKLDALLRELAPVDQAIGTLIENLAKANGIDLTHTGLTDPDNLPPAPEPAQVYVRPGDLWLLGEHRLLCGDASEEADLRRVMGGELADCVWTDPPWGVRYVGKTSEALTIENDDDGADLLVRAMFEAARGVVVPGAPFYCAAPAGPRSVSFQQAILAAGWRIHQELVWVKDAFVLGHSDYHFQHEVIHYGWAPGPGRSGRGDRLESRWYGDHRQSSVLSYDRPRRSEEHPTMKPVALVAHCLANSTPVAGSVLDPFSGSGSTILAATQLGRRCFAIDLDSAYVQVAKERWEAYTGLKAVRDG